MAHEGKIKSICATWLWRINNNDCKLSTYWGRDKKNDIAQTIISKAFFSNEDVWILLASKGQINNISALVQIMAR